MGKKTETLISSVLASLTKSIVATVGRLELNALPPISFCLNPTPASRPRVTRWGVFYTKTYKNWRAAAEEFVEQAKDVTTAPLIVVVDVRGARPKSTKRISPRGDIDNFVKAPLDMLNKNAFGDDDQIVGLWATKQYATTEDEVGTTVSIYEIT